MGELRGTPKYFTNSSSMRRYRNTIMIFIKFPRNQQITEPELINNFEGNFFSIKGTRLWE